MSTLKTNKITTTAGVEVYTAKAWVNFNGTGTVAIRASGNVSSITDNGTGDYTVNFTTAMQDVNYTMAGSFEGGVSPGSLFPYVAGGTGSAPTLVTTTQYRMKTEGGTDANWISASFTR
jgi:hypothetical protein